MVFKSCELTSGDNQCSPDKNFIESLKDAMRTIVNHKETEKDRSKAPELLAQYSDQLLKDKKVNF